VVFIIIPSAVARFGLAPGGSKRHREPSRVFPEGVVFTGPPDWKVRKNRLTGRLPPNERFDTLGELGAQVGGGVKGVVA